MNKEKMMELVDMICEEEGYSDSPAYDLIYSECCEGRSNTDAEEMIREMLADYNGISKIKQLAKVNANDNPSEEIVYIEMDKETFEITLSNGDDTGELPPTNEVEAIELAKKWQNWNTFEWLI